MLCKRTMKTKENLFALAWREIALLRTNLPVFFAHEFHEFSCKRVQSRTCSGYAERSRKCQEKVHLYEQNRTFTAQKQQGETQHPVKTTSISVYFQDRSAILASPPSPSPLRSEGEGGDA